jgi:hypothetical protein
MSWFADILKALFGAILDKYGDRTPTVAEDGIRRPSVLRRAGVRIREWMHSRRASERGKSDPAGAGMQDQGVRDD